MYIHDILWSSLACHFNWVSFWDQLKTTFSSPLDLIKMQGSCTSRQNDWNFAAPLSGGVYSETHKRGRDAEGHSARRSEFSGWRSAIASLSVLGSHPCRYFPFDGGIRAIHRLSWLSHFMQQDWGVPLRMAYALTNGFDGGWGAPQVSTPSLLSKLQMASAVLIFLMWGIWGIWAPQRNRKGTTAPPTP